MSGGIHTDSPERVDSYRSNEVSPELDISSSPPWQLIDLQDCLHDSPQFRRMLTMKEEELVDLERKLQKVVTSCSTMVKSGQVYRENCRLFSLSVKELGDHFTELPNVKDAVQKFCDVFNEIQTYYRVLFDQAQRTVMNGLKDFLTGELRKVHNSKKSFHKTSAELSYVIQKNATASRQKPTEADEMSSLLQTTQVEFTHQALDYCYQVNVVSCLKSHRITEKLVSFLGSTSTFFHQGFDSLKHLDSYLRNVVKEIDDLQMQSNTDINYMRDRHSLVSSQHMQDEPINVSMESISMPIVFRGYLFKRAHNAFKSWNRRYFELRDGKLFYLKKDSENTYGVIADDLRLCTVKLADDLERRFCFEIVSPTRSCMLQADSEVDRKKWCMYLEAGIARALRVTTSNKSRDTRRRLTSSATVTPHLIESLNDTPTSYHRSDTPSSLNSNVSCSFDFLDIPGNDICADCCRPNPKWASLNLGIILCIDCSGIHRSLGVHISKVRSITLDDWETEHQKIMSLLGNDRVNSIFEFQVPAHVKKPTSTTSSSEREEYIRLKYVNRAFVHPHPDFVRPKVPIPPPRIQGTLLRAAATSPKLAGRLNRPVSMATCLETRPSPTSSPLPFNPSPLSGGGENSPFGGMNLRPENMALLEENWKKLEKNGRLQQWNLKSMYNVVKSPRKTFSLSKFARPGSFRKRKSPLITDDDYPHSDNELEGSLSSFHSITHAQSHPASPDSAYPPQKPPRTYTTTYSQIESPQESKSLFKTEGDDFSSDLMSTFERLGSVYSISGLLKEEMDGSELSDNVRHHLKISRSVSAVAQLNSGSQLTKKESDIPTINVMPQSFDEDDLKEEDEANTETTSTQATTNLQREVSHSVGSLLNLDDTTPLVITTPTHLLPANSSDHEEIDMLNIEEEDDLRDRTLKSIDYAHFVPDDDDSSIDSFMSAEDRNEFLLRHQSSSPHEIRRPDSEASELFHTPPNSMSPSPSGLESISPSHVTNLGKALGVNISLEDSQTVVKRSSDALDISSLDGDLRDLNIHNDYDDVPHDVSPLEPIKRQNEAVDVVTSNADSPSNVISDKDTHSTNVSDLTPGDDAKASVITPSALSPHGGSSREDGGCDDVREEEGVEEVDKAALDAVFQSDSVNQFSDYDVHIVPEDISPSAFIFECSLNGDLGGILSGIAHGGAVNLPHKEEGSRYPIHQPCITGNEATVEFLYQNGAKVNVLDDRGCSPLHLASMNGYQDLVAVLLKRSANYKCVDKEGNDPLTYAANRGNTYIVSILKSVKEEQEALLGEDSCANEDTNESADNVSVTTGSKGSPEGMESEIVNSRSVSSTNSSSSTDRITSGSSELSVASGNKVSGLVMNTKSKPDT